MGAFGLLLQKTFENAKDVSIMFYVRANLRNVFVTMNGCNTYIILFYYYYSISPTLERMGYSRSSILAQTPYQGYLIIIIKN